MSEQWMSVAQAAASMQVHPRTVERRIASGKIQSRRSEDGQVQILVNLPDTARQSHDTAMETVKELADRQVDIAAGSNPTQAATQVMTTGRICTSPVRRMAAARSKPLSIRRLK